MIKKLIGFEETFFNKIEEYAKEKNITFTEAVRVLIDAAFSQNTSSHDLNYISNVLDETIKQVEKLTKENAWFKADDTQSKLHNLEIDINNIKEQMEKNNKTMNILTSSLKLFKKHVDNREIHLQD